MKILMLGNSAGGTYHFRVELLQELLKRKHEVFLSVPYDDYVKRIEELGCKVIPTEFDRRGMNPKQEQRLYREYCRIIKEVQPDKILTYTIKPNIYGGIAAKKFGIPQIANIQRLHEGDTVLPEWIGNEKQVLTRMYLVCDSKQELANALKYYQDTVKVYDEAGNEMLLNGFDVDKALEMD